jgi:Sec-independent protein translocase protein TatA
MTSKLFVAVLLLVCLGIAQAFLNIPRASSIGATKIIQQRPSISLFKMPSFGSKIVYARKHPLKDLLGLGPAEIAVTLVVALVLFGPETLKSLSKDVGRAAAELKEIPKTFKEGMDEGAESAQVTRMKAIAAEKRKMRDEKLKGIEENEEKDVQNGGK